MHHELLSMLMPEEKENKKLSKKEEESVHILLVEKNRDLDDRRDGTCRGSRLERRHSQNFLSVFLERREAGISRRCLSTRRSSPPPWFWSRIGLTRIVERVKKKKEKISCFILVNLIPTFSLIEEKDFFLFSSSSHETPCALL